MGNPFGEPQSTEEILRAMWVDLKEIKVEVQRTNGRVTQLEQARHDADLVRRLTLQMAGAALAIVGVVAPIVGAVVAEVMR